MFTSEFNERSRSNPLCDFRLGTVVTSDHETPSQSEYAKDCIKSIQQSMEVGANFCLQGYKSDKGAINKLKALKKMFTD